MSAIACPPLFVMPVTDGPLMASTARVTATWIESPTSLAKVGWFVTLSTPAKVFAAELLFRQAWSIFLEIRSMILASLGCSSSWAHLRGCPG